MQRRFHAFVTGVTTCYKYIQRIKSAEMTEFGLKGTHVMCLFYLGHNPEGLTATQLCQLCAEDKAAISRSLAELEGKGYVYLQQPEGKKYRAQVCLTGSGKEIAQRMDALIEEWVSVGGDGLTDGEREGFYKGLELIASNLKEKYETR